MNIALPSTAGIGRRTDASDGDSRPEGDVAVLLAHP
jgi:hypothetical protein